MKGLHLYRENRVVLLVLNGDEVYAEVKGSSSHLYKVVFTLADECSSARERQRRVRIRKAVCECRYVGEGWCRHIVAVLFCIAEKRYIQETMESVECVDLERSDALAMCAVPDTMNPSHLFETRERLFALRSRRVQSATASMPHDVHQLPPPPPPPLRSTSVFVDLTAAETHETFTTSSSLATACTQVHPQDQDNEEQQEQHLTSTSDTKLRQGPYIPRYRSGAWALLIALYTASLHAHKRTSRHERQEHTTELPLLAMKKAELIKFATPLCDASFEESSFRAHCPHFSSSERCVSSSQCVRGAFCVVFMSCVRVHVLFRDRSLLFTHVMC